MHPRISILMPVWNGETFLAAAVDSLLAQTFTDFELLVIDDGSTDRTAEILQDYTDPRLRVLRLDHAGIVVALNRGMSAAQADWIARLDADDISEPRRLERQWQAVSRHPRAVLCHTAITFFGGGDITPGKTRLPRSRSFTALRLCHQCPVVHSTVLFKKSVALAAGGYLPEERHAEDFSLWGRMLEMGEFIALPEKLVRFRVHQQSVSRQNLEAQQALARRIGTRHCQKFFQHDESEAIRANALLLTASNERSWRDWWWFLTRCAPRLRWQSAETLGWLTWQTLKLIGRSK
jgi:glycosyltransferase involved in cell wall biosynthesis